MIEGNETGGADTKPQVDICARCQRTIPASTVKCPFCGLPQRTTSKVVFRVLGVCGLIILLFVIGQMLYSARQPIDTQDSAKPVDTRPALGN